MTTFVGTSHTDHFSGGSQNDLFEMGAGGDDVVSGGGGDDVFNFGHAFTDNDQIDGGAGFDVLNLKGRYFFQDYNFGQALNLEEIHLGGGHSYQFDVQEAAVGAGKSLIIDGKSLGPDDVLAVYGGHETDGTLQLIGGNGNDLLEGGALGDVLRGGGGQDTLVGDTQLTGVSSGDKFVFRAVSDSTVEAPDTVEWDPSTGDRIDLHKIDADTNISGDQRFHFIGTASFSDTAGELRYESSAGGYLITGDVNGDGVADFGIEADPNNQGLPGALIAHEFVL